MGRGLNMPSLAPAPEQCVILVGGLGTRLGALTGGGPKPLAPVGGRPFLTYLLWHARRMGFARVLLLAGHKSGALLDLRNDLAAEAGLVIEVVVEPEPLGTAGALRFAAAKLDPHFLLLNGDSLFDVNWLDLPPLAGAGSRVSLALRREADTSRYGVVRLDGERVSRFDVRGDDGGGLINAGVYLVSRDVAQACPERGSFEREVLPHLAAEGRVHGRRMEGLFIDIGVPESLALAQTLVPASLRRGAVFFDRDGVLNHDTGYVHRQADFHWTQGAAAAVKAVNDAGLFAFLITNQAGVARGLYGEAEVASLHDWLRVELRRQGAHLDDVRYCPHHPEGVVRGFDAACDWRKPAPGMILDLLRRWPVDPARSLVVGDQPTDLQAAAAAGVAAARFPGGDLEAFLRPRLAALG